MSWSDWVIIGLCSLNLLLFLGLIGFAKAKLAPTLNLAEALIRPKTHPPATIGAGRGKGGEPPKDNGSVILMTSERDAKLLGDEDE